MYLPLAFCLLVLASGQNFYKSDIRIQNFGTEFPSASLIVDFGKTDRGFIDNWPFMELRITSSETLLYKNDGSYYNNFDCEKGTSCEVVDEKITSYPDTWFQGEFKASRIKPTLSIAGNIWQIQSSALYVQLDEGESGKNVNHPYGSIGLGIGGNGNSNYQTQYPVFSLRLFNETQRGELIFGKDLTKTDSKKDPLIFNTNLNWEAPVKSLSLGSSKKDVEKTKFFFDLAYTKIAVPISFKESIKEFATKHEMTEDGLFYYAGDLAKLPNFEVTMGDDKVLSIPPHIYMKKNPDFRPEEYCLRIEALQSVEDYVVFGQSVISDYYIVFEAENPQIPTISVYALADPNDDTPPKKDSGISPLWIVFGVVLLLVASSAAYWCGKKSQAQKLEEYLNEKQTEKASLIA